MKSNQKDKIGKAIARITVQSCTAGWYDCVSGVVVGYPAKIGTKKY